MEITDDEIDAAVAEIFSQNNWDGFRYAVKRHPILLCREVQDKIGERIRTEKRDVNVGLLGILKKLVEIRDLAELYCKVCKDGAKKK